VKSRKKLSVVAPITANDGARVVALVPEGAAPAVQAVEESPAAAPPVAPAPKKPSALAARLAEKNARGVPRAPRTSQKAARAPEAPKAPEAVVQVPPASGAAAWSDRTVGWTPEHSKRLKASMEFYELSVQVDREVQHLVMALLALHAGDFETAGLNLFAAGLTLVSPEAVEEVEVD